MEDSERFPRLIDGIDQFHNTPKAYRRCYKGLLAAYFTYDPDGEGVPSAGTQNWTILRSYLELRIKALHDNGHLEWIPAIREHSNLLSDKPCDRYAALLLKDDDTLFQQAKDKLEISDASWVIRKLVLSQIGCAAEHSDDRFLDLLPKLLALIAEYKLIKDDGLAIILNRYSESSATPVHVELRESAVNSWGNPWLSRNSARWSRTTEAARNMVTGWLKLKFIDMFFRLLTEDGTADTRRLKFWQSHHDKIDDMYFALGSHARLSLNADFVELREKMTGRVLELAGAGSPVNNAFIMRIGDSTIVEFGSKGNACFVFDHAQLPFKLSGTVRGDSTSLKHDSNKLRLRHADGRWKTWERQFEDEIPVLRSSARSNASASAAVRQRQTRATVKPGFSRAELSKYCTAMNLRIEDLTGRGGNLWVRTSNVNSLVSDQLASWGFSYKDGKGWWKE